MNWRDFLPLASRLATGATESDWRSAVSRAYYAAFHVARRYFSELNFTVPRADRAHQYFVFRLGNSSEPTVEQAGRELDTLRRLRNRADYDESPALTQSQAAASVRLAESFVQTLDSARQEPSRTRMRDAMIAYERAVLRDVTWKP
ncbi:MAG: HEPN domain-containing protein [Planctomycetia bacterium]|nr:HEPN domain-containing protein [Planctomycetia bacterium]